MGVILGIYRGYIRVIQVLTVEALGCAMDPEPKTQS